MERNTRKVLVGTVVSSTNDKTITVKVETHRRHPLYSKRIKYSRNLLLMMKTIKLKLAIS